LGVDAIPAGWYTKLENQEYITELAQWLFEMKVGLNKENKRIKPAIERWNQESARLNQELLEEL